MGPITVHRRQHVARLGLGEDRRWRRTARFDPHTLRRVSTVREARPEDVEQCVDVLARLPDHFTPDTHDEVRGAWASDLAWVAVDGEEIIGFVLVQRRHPATVEITFAAVEPTRHRSGVGRMLVDTALGALDGVVLVEVKTLDASAGYEPYEATRAFWERCGFHQVDRIDPLPGWQPGNPAAIYVAAVGGHPVAEQSPGGRRRTDRHANERGTPHPDGRGGDHRHRRPPGCLW